MKLIMKRACVRSGVSASNVQLNVCYCFIILKVESSFALFLCSGVFTI